MSFAKTILLSVSDLSALETMIVEASLPLSTLASSPLLAAVIPIPVFSPLLTTFPIISAFPTIFKIAPLESLTAVTSVPESPASLIAEIIELPANVNTFPD